MKKTSAVLDANCAHTVCAIAVAQDGIFHVSGETKTGRADAWTRQNAKRGLKMVKAY